jgi:hypothetical protein
MSGMITVFNLRRFEVFGISLAVLKNLTDFMLSSIPKPMPLD